jgi:hypothetical protein
MPCEYLIRGVRTTEIQERQLFNTAKPTYIHICNKIDDSNERFTIFSNT